jgi:hypothetical protein
MLHGLATLQIRSLLSTSKAHLSVFKRFEQPSLFDPSDRAFPLVTISLLHILVVTADFLVTCHLRTYVSGIVANIHIPLFITAGEDEISPMSYP